MQAAVHFTRGLQLLILHFQLAGKSGLRPVGQGGQHLARLVGIVVNGLLAQQHDLRLLLVHHGLEQLGNGQRLQFGVGLHQNGAIGANGQRGAQGFLVLRHAARDGDNFCHHAFFLQTHRLLHGDFVKGVHAHLDVGGFHPALVAFDANLHVVVHHALDGDKCFHAAFSLGD